MVNPKVRAIEEEDHDVVEGHSPACPWPRQLVSTRAERSVRGQLLHFRVDRRPQLVTYPTKALKPVRGIKPHTNPATAAAAWRTQWIASSSSS
eukprot:scaffold2641_cov380-Prasinococcus_capsulatus_cf.AAC.6